MQEEECAYGQKDVTDAEDIGQRPRTRRRKDVSEEGQVRVEQTPASLVVTVPPADRAKRGAWVDGLSAELRQGEDRADDGP